MRKEREGKERTRKANSFRQERAVAPRRYPASRLEHAGQLGRRSGGGVRSGRRGRLLPQQQRHDLQDRQPLRRDARRLRGWLPQHCHLPVLFALGGVRDLHLLLGLQPGGERHVEVVHVVEAPGATGAAGHLTVTAIALHHD